MGKSPSSGTVCAALVPKGGEWSFGDQAQARPNVNPRKRLRLERILGAFNYRGELGSFLGHGFRIARLDI